MLSKIKNNPKKIIFFSGLLCYGVYYSNEKFKENQLRRKFCDNAKQLGDQSIHPLKELTRVTVIHNPYANNRKSSKLFKKNIFPLLNLSGYKVTVVETERVEEAKELMSVLKPDDQDCLFVAGGDGTLLEVATGLLRRSDLRGQMHRVPLVLAPLGALNSFVTRQDDQLRTEDNISACSRVVDMIANNRIRPTNALAIRTIPEPATVDSELSAPKEIYALSGLEWSVDRDVVQSGKRKWLFGPYRRHVQYIWTGLLGRHLSTAKSATLSFVESCDGCSKCANGPQQQQEPPPQGSSSSWMGSFARFMLPVFFKDTIAREKQQRADLSRKSKIENPRCGVVQEKPVQDARGLSVVIDGDRLRVSVNSTEPGLAEFVRTGIARLADIPYRVGDNADDTFECQQLKIIPDSSAMTQKFYVDNEELDVVPVELTVLKDALYLFS